MARLAALFFKTIHLVVVIVYLLACLVPALPAGEYWFVAVIGLVFPLLFVVLCFFLVGWLVARSRWWVLSLVAIAISWQQVAAFAAWRAEKPFAVAKDPATLRVLTWNVSSWGETSKRYNPHRDERADMLELVKNQNADLLCLQEFWDERSARNMSSNIAAFRKMGYTHSFFAQTSADRWSRHTGVVILSKYPLADTARFTYGEVDNAEDLIYADVVVNQHRIRVFTTHLQSVRFDQDEYVAISKIKHRDEEGLKDSKTIFRKLRTGYMFRGGQADLVREKIKESPYPVIVCGDFNDVPNSYTYFTIRGNLQDAFLARGSGVGRTFQYLFPTLRIDYILADKRLAVEQYHRITAPYSDHFPVLADFRLQSPATAAK